MKLVHPDIQTPIEFEENIINSLVIEEPTLLLKLTDELIRQMQTDEGDYILSVNDTILSLNRTAYVITSLFDFDFNNKQFSTAIHKKLEEIAFDEENYPRTMELLSEIARYINQLSEQTDYSLSIKDNAEMSKVLKSVDLELFDDSESKLEQLFNYIKMIRDVLGKKIIILINIRMYFNQDQLNILYKTLLQNKIFVLFIDGSVIPEISNEEKRVIIDMDLCEI